MLEAIGWIGALCFAICAIPQAWQSYQNGTSDGINLGFLALWFTGEVLTLIYVLPSKSWPLVFNYVGNILALLVIIKFKLFPRRVRGNN